MDVFEKIAHKYPTIVKEMCWAAISAGARIMDVYSGNDFGVEIKGDDSPVTLADMMHEGLLIFCWCNRCCHNSTVDPVQLTNELGSFFPVPELSGRMRCSVCQSRDITTRPAWPHHGGGQITRHS